MVFSLDCLLKEVVPVTFDWNMATAVIAFFALQVSILGSVIAFALRNENRLATLQGLMDALTNRFAQLEARVSTIEKHMWMDEGARNAKVDAHHKID